ncbi:hypothetical protein FB45DRAFT_927012 [Roridomyces roridus]|uniref:Uncharacterized protein n=1 Tax=Roridomyces roridus TaxID=1738132 RepID=A0AAD7BIT2_9AGAR|nr:hypothetical protein FB45DRAFT_927012 [Roridomyces roridus]
MLVAWRVKAWVEPLRYRVLLFSEGRPGLHSAWKYPHQDDDAFSHTFSIPPAVLRASVRHLCIHHSDKELAKFLLPNCLSVYDLWASTHAALDLVGALRLRRLHCALKAVFDSTPVDFTHSLFIGLTHLEIFDYAEELPGAIWSNVALIPNLTHLAFNDDGFLPYFPMLLRTCASLRVLALVEPTPIQYPPSAEIPDELAPDTRFVWMACTEYIKDWHQGALTGKDYWLRAEAFIDRRRRGEVRSPLQYWFEEDSSEGLP